MTTPVRELKSEPTHDKSSRYDLTSFPKATITKSFARGALLTATLVNWTPSLAPGAEVHLGYESPAKLSDPLINQVSKLACLSDSWNGYGAEKPSAWAIDAAYHLVDACRTSGVIPTKIVPDADGGIDFYFMSTVKMPGGASRRRACIQLFNDGIVECFFDDRGDANRSEFFELDLDDYESVQARLACIGEFIRA